MTPVRQPPWPLIEIAVEPRSKKDRVRLEASLAAMRRDDPALWIQAAPEAGHVILGGCDENHLERSVTTLRDVHAVDIILGSPQVAYRETTTRRTEVDFTHKKLFGPKSEFARVKLAVTPRQRGAGSLFAPRIVVGAVPQECMAGVETGIASVLNGGILAGCPVVDIEVALVDGAYHDVDSSPRAFEIAARAALREALQKGGSVLLEPVMTVEVVCSDRFVGSVTRDLVSRRGRITGRHVRENRIVIDGDVPFANLFGYANALRAVTLGEGTFTSRFAHYEAMPSTDGDLPRPPAAAAALRA